MTTDLAPAIALTRSQCEAVMSSSDTGRIAIATQAWPVVVPVSYVLDGDRIVISTGDDAAIAAVSGDRIIAFETDGGPSSNPWSVFATGVARAVSDPVERDRLEALPWLPGRPDGLLTMSTGCLSGRRTAGPAVMTEAPQPVPVG